MNFVISFFPLKIDGFFCIKNLEFRESNFNRSRNNTASNVNINSFCD